MLKKTLIPVLIIALLSLAVLAAACSSDDNGDEPTNTPPVATEPQGEEPTQPAGDGNAETVSEVSLREFAIDVATDSVPAGSVTFAVRNDGTIIHDLRVIKTDLAPDALPEDESSFTVDESQVDVVGATENLDVGQSEDLVLDLEPGSYVLICNIATHYDAGMHLAFTVE